MEFGQSVGVMVSWLAVALVITINSSIPVHSMMTNCNCGGPGDTSLEVQKDMIQNLNMSAQDAMRFYLESGILNRRFYKNYVNNKKVTLRLPEAGTDADLGAMQDTNIDCLTKVMEMVILIGNNTNVSSTYNLEGLRQKLETIRTRTCHAYCRLTGSRTSSSASPRVCLQFSEQCGGHCTSIIRLRDISNIAIEMVRRYNSLDGSQSHSK